MLKKDNNMRNFVESLDLKERLDPREYFYGGRTNATKLQYEVKKGEKIHYVDFTSLYPFVNKYAQYPIKQPTIVTNEFKRIDNYFGIAKVKVFPLEGYIILYYH